MVLGILGSVKYRNVWLNTIKDMRRYEFTGVDGGSNMELEVGVDTAGDGDRGVLYDGHCHPFRLKE